VNPIPSVVADQNPWRREGGTVEPRSFRVERSAERTIWRRLVDPGYRRAQLLLGPRQVGKTTLLRRLVGRLLAAGWPASQVVYFDCSDDRLLTTFSLREVAEAVVAPSASERPPVLLLDEITRAERWAAWLKQAVDAGSFRIVATDSAAALLRDAQDESGLGRWDEIPIEPFSLAEMLELEGQGAPPGEVLAARPELLGRYLEVGGFPEYRVVSSASEAQSRLREDISNRAIRRDLLRAGIDVEGARRLFVYLVQSSGAIFDVAKAARALEVDRRSVESWVERLGATGLVHRLDGTTGSPQTRLRAKPKLYACDPGLVSAFALPADGRDDLEGRRLETAVFRHLREALLGSGWVVGFLPGGSSQEREVDFLLEAPDGDRGVALEVTAARQVRADKLEQLRRPVPERTRLRRLLVYGGAAGAERDGVTSVPLPQFLLDPGSFLSLEEA
jgi:uncharacterized protein